ncbi:U-box-domain-containing protein [Coccomyxa subellipsoidea C-169]|uniref:U-box-domain-containing protein n=1 Tax=Coccomyxa subellipsoidea (strain C-169) TaxID=574566 RepID=I0YZ48_COCSC|nr:U-box-domain-containing protein [Coccomyxa subellipsoidea C-169]EIE23667.1 U-box-domain-containing protein [Coccomyxa subellipsoidea C-169]|eukprot:XP_005648211.1 U-box-domain-containing protein [Coccomyxa subellipsoidea C-169]
MEGPKHRMSGNGAHTPEKRKLLVAESPNAGAAAFQTWLEEEEEEWRVGQKLAATCPAEFICPISLDMMTEPVILAETGMTYERAAIRKWFFMGGDTCPLTGVRLSTTKVMAHKHLQRRIEKWVRTRGMPHDDEESMADSLKAAMQSSFDEPDLCARSLGGLEDHGAAPGSPGASTTAPSTVGASTIGPSSIHKMSKPGKARSEGSSSRRGGRSRSAAAPAPAAADSNVKRSSILLRALSSSTLAILTSAASSRAATPNATPRSKCEPVCEGDPSCEVTAVPEDAPEELLLLAPPNSPAVLPTGCDTASGQHKRTVSLEELPRAPRGTRISVSNPVYREFKFERADEPASPFPAKPAAAALSTQIHATCSGASESVELVEGPVVEELQAEKVDLPLEEGGVVLGEAAPMAPPETDAECGAAPNGGGGDGVAEPQGKRSKAKKGKEKKRRHKAEWVSVTEAPPSDGCTLAGAHQLEAASRCTSTASYFTTVEQSGETEGTPAPAALSKPACDPAGHAPPPEGTSRARSGLLRALSRSFSSRRALRPDCEGRSSGRGYLPSRLSETGTGKQTSPALHKPVSLLGLSLPSATSGAIVARASAERQRSVAALLTSAAVPGLTALALRTLSCLGYHRLFWMRCFGGCMSAPDVLSLDIPEDAGMRMQSILDADEYFHSEDAEVVSVHRFARRIIADYMPPVTAGVP